MKLQILKGEYLFSEQGTHVLDERGFAVQAQEDCECEVSEEHYERVSQLVASDRQFRLGLPLEEMPPNELVEVTQPTEEQAT